MRGGKKQQAKKGRWSVKATEQHDRTVVVKNPQGVSVASFHRDRDGDVTVRGSAHEKARRLRSWSAMSAYDPPEGPESIPIQHLRSAVEKITEGNP